MGQWTAIIAYYHPPPPLSRLRSMKYALSSPKIPPKPTSSALGDLPTELLEIIFGYVRPSISPNLVLSLNGSAIGRQSEGNKSDLLAVQVYRRHQGLREHCPEPR